MSLQGEIVQLTMSRNSPPGGLAMNVFYFRVLTAYATCQDIANELAGMWSQRLNGRLVSGAPLNNHLVRCMTVPTAPAGAKIQNWATQSGESLPPQMCLKIRLRSGAVPSRMHGKVYTVAPLAFWNTGGVVNSYAQGQFDAWVGEVTPLYLGDNASKGLSLVWRGDRRNGGNLYIAVQWMELNPYFSTQRSRRPGVGA